MSQFTSLPRTFTTAMAAVLFAAPLVAQGAPDTTRTKVTSSKRIPIHKEGAAGGDVVATRHDTVTVYNTRVDTVRLVHTDTIRLNGRVQMVTRYDTVRLAAPVVVPAVVRLPDGLYFGVAAGVSAPAAGLFQSNNTGGSGQAQLGWQAAAFPLGIRFDVNYARFGQDAAFAQSQENGRVITGSGDLRLGLPVLTHLLGLSPRFGLYGLGGLSYVSYQDLQRDLKAGVCCGTGPLNTSAPSDGGRMGWNTGGGASLAWGHKELFVEARVISFRSEDALVARHVPIVLGMNWY